eukprot:TRINITY_DN1055_c0_g1_i11.p1 TRINITY_DN1055_c0_g1~~TRINITY_DN1055_c0_g1_i11.p1  ORF type:complete len:151 (+),score=24.26 TRINITY_DN1055_c0_g1_i11:458-910(+)
MWGRRHTMDDLQKLHLNDPEKMLSQKTGAVAFLVKRCDSDMYQPDNTLRIALFDGLLDKYPNLTKAYGNCRKNVKVEDTRNTLGYLETAVEIYKTFKFAITLENAAHPGYITEKIVNGFLANTIPVYFGDSRVKELFNPKRFIYCEFPVS